MHTVKVYDLGLQSYQPVWELQKKLQKARIAGQIMDCILFVEHLPVYTLGKLANNKHLLASQNFLKEWHIEVVSVDRGGEITYHGPGQVVCYPIIDLNQYKKDVGWYVTALEEVVIETLKNWNIVGQRNKGHRGVWVDNSKIAAIGVKISKWVTMHGFALNVQPDVALYTGIIPCGIVDKQVTSMKRVLGEWVEINQIKHVIIQQFEEIFKIQTLLSETTELNAELQGEGLCINFEDSHANSS